MTIAVASPEYAELVTEVKSLRTAVGSPSSEIDTRTTSLETEQAKILMGDVEYTADQAITDNTAFDLCTIPVPDENAVCVEVRAAIYVDDGTNHQCISILAHVKAVNKAGSITAVVTEGIADVVAASSGTLTLAVAAAEGADNVLDISITANSSLTPTTMTVSWQAKVLLSSNGDGLTAVNANA